MASKIKHHEKTAAGGGALVTRLCSISSAGLVFLSTNRLDVSSDVTLAVQTTAPGAAHEWEVHGWVVDCRVARCREGLCYKVTLLFHDLPAGLRGILAEEKAAAPCSFPPLRNAPVFGLN